MVSVLSKKHHDCLYLGTVTIIGPDGEPLCIPQSQIAQVQRGQIKPGPDGTITVLGADGRPVKIPASAVDTPVSSALKFIPTAGRNLKLQATDIEKFVETDIKRLYSLMVLH